MWLAVILILCASQAAPGDTLQVPLDHRRPSQGTFTLYYELGAPFDPAKPTVLYVSDDLQSRVRPGRMGELQAEWFGDRLNVVGVPGRIISEELTDWVTAASGEVDWSQAYRLFASRQWCADLDAVRRELLGDDGRVMLFGNSSGAFLAQEYLWRYGQHCSRAFLEAALNPHLDAELGIVPGHFPGELGAQDAASETGLAELLASPQGMALRVRIYELIQPVCRGWDPDGSRSNPVLERVCEVARPLLAAEERREVRLPRFDFAALGSLATEVFLLAARWDQAVDYRMQIDLARRMPRAKLFLADDDQMLAGLEGSGLLGELVSTFLLSGAESPQTRAVLQRMQPHRWTGLPEPPPMPVGVRGADCPRVLKAYIREHVGEIQAATAPLLRRAGSAGGTVHLRMIWEGERLTAAKVLADDTGQPAVADAIVSVLRRWTIPRLDAPCDVSMPLRVRLTGR